MTDIGRLVGLCFALIVCAFAIYGIRVAFGDLEEHLIFRIDSDAVLIVAAYMVGRISWRLGL